MNTETTKIDRSGAKWLPGAMALAAASTQAATVQVTLTGKNIAASVPLRFQTRFLASLVAAFAFVWAAPAHAATVLSNLTEPISSTDYPIQSQWLAQSFDTDGRSWVLNAVTVSSDGGNQNFNTGNFFVQIYASSGSGDSRTPGTLLGSLSGTDKPILRQLYTYTTAGINLDPFSRYWVVMGVSSGDPDYNLNYAEDVAATGVWSYPYGGRFGGVVARSSNQGSSWSLNNYGPFLLEFDATVAVPEPSALALVGLGTVGLIARRRRVG
jgi:hypothetical protein